MTFADGNQRIRIGRRRLSHINIVIYSNNTVSEAFKNRSGLQNSTIFSDQKQTLTV